MAGIRWKANTAALLGVLAVVCIGCEPKPTVFDVSAIDKIESLAVLPLRSDSDPSAGAILAGLLGTRLEKGRWDRLAIVEAPVLWRLVAEAGGGAAPDAARAADIARQMGATAALTGTVGYTSEPDPDASKLPGMKREQTKSVQFLRNFALRKGQTNVKVQIVSADGGNVIYEHTSLEEGLSEATQLRKAVEKVILPLERHLQNTRGKRKEPQP